MSVTRTLTLMEGASYSIDNIVFKKRVPQEVPTHLYYRLLKTGVFQENPAFCYYHVRIKNISGSRIIQMPDGRYITFSGGKHLRVSHWEWSQIKHMGCFEIVSPLEVMQELAANGRDNFSVLVIRDQNLGDVVLCTEILYNLRRMFPEATIDFATQERFIGVFDNVDFVDKAHVIGEVDTASYDISVNLCEIFEQMPDMAQKERLDIAGEAFSPNFPFIERGTHLELSDSERDWIVSFDRRHNKEWRPVALLTPFGSGPHRSIHPDHIREVADWLVECGYFVYIVGQKNVMHPEFAYLDDRYFTSSKHVSVIWDTFSLRQFISLCAIASFCICPDTATYHITQAFGVPTVVVFTTISEAVRTTYYPKAYPLRASELSCSPCWDRPCKWSLEPECLAKIDAERIIEHCKKAMWEGFPEVERQKLNLSKPRFV